MLQTSMLASVPSAEAPSQGWPHSPAFQVFLQDLNSAHRVYELFPVVPEHVKVKAMNKLGS